MQTVLFNSTIFGPIHSRRLGSSLGINLSPDDGKICSFDCLYCEAGYNSQGIGTTGFPSREKVKTLLREKLSEIKKVGESLDVITFSGNGEPTLHPDFGGIIDDTIEARNEFFPDVKISVLTNSTRLENAEVAEALMKIDNPILKLDSAINSTIALLDRPSSSTFTSEKIIPLLSRFGSKAIIQTLLTQGEHNGEKVDNTSTSEINALIEAYRQIAPGSIMLYTIDRPTPEKTLRRIRAEQLQKIAERITSETGIPVQVSA